MDIKYGFDGLNNDKERLACARAYDRYIQDANDNNRYYDGWYPVCLDEFADCEWTEIKGDRLRVMSNICQEYFDTKDNENCYAVCNAHGGHNIEGVIVTDTDDHYAYLYKSWEDLYLTNIRYSIQDDFNTIGGYEVRNYLDEEAFEFVCKDLNLEGSCNG